MEKVWVLTSQWTIEDDGNADEQLHGVFSDDTSAKEWDSKNSIYDEYASRTYWLMEWQIGNPKWQGRFFWIRKDNEGTWVKVDEVKAGQVQE